MNTFHQSLPGTIGMSALDMKQVAPKSYDSAVINGRDKWPFTAVVDVTVTGGPGTTGAATLSLVLLEEDESTVLYTVDLVTAISLLADGTKCVVTFGGGADGAVASGSGFSGTIGANVDVPKVIGPFKLRLTETTISDATTCACDVTLIAGRA